MEQLRGIQGAPGPVRAPDLVDHQRVRVQLRVAGPAGPLIEQRHRQPARLDLLDPVRAPAGQSGVRVQVGQTRLDRGPVRPHRRDRDVRVFQRPQGTDTLRGRKGQVEPGDRVSSPRPPQPVPGAGVQAAGEQRLELTFLDTSPPAPTPARRGRDRATGRAPPPPRGSTPSPHTPPHRCSSATRTCRSSPNSTPTTPPSAIARNATTVPSKNAHICC